MSSFKAELYTAIYNRIRDDETLQDLFPSGEVPVEFEIVPPNLDWPYLVMKITHNNAGQSNFIRTPRLYIDLWSVIGTSSEDNLFAIDVIDRLEKLFNGKICYATKGWCMFSYAEDFSVPVIQSGGGPMTQINRHAIVFNLRSADGTLIESLLES
jgi:hypothetical protein